MESNDDDDEQNSNVILYRQLMDDCQQLLKDSKVGGHRSATKPAPTKTDCGGSARAGTTTQSCAPPPSPPTVQKKTSAYRLPECRSVGHGAVAAKPRCCGGCSRTVRRDVGRGCSVGPSSCRPLCNIPSFWSTVGGWARTAACRTWAKKSYFFVAVASFALGLYADDYCHCVYESDY